MTDIIENSAKYIANTYSRFPVVLVSGKGCRVQDVNGKGYLDFVSGLAVNNLGHCHPNIVKAIKEQADKLLHVSNLYHIEPQVKLAEALCNVSFAEKVFFCNSGAEANEAAIKLARKYAKDKGREKRFEIITMMNSFHGRTLATLSATAQEKYQKGFEPLVPGFKYTPFNDLKALEEAITPETCAVMVEIIQGEGGVNCPADGYIPGLRDICDEKEILLIVDEIQTGLGRTGKMFAYQHYAITPDIMTLAKSLAGGLPIGAMLTREEIANSFTPGTHASTFGGNPFTTAVGVVAIKTIIEERLSERAREMGDILFSELMKLKSKFPFIKEVRGKGLLLGMELGNDDAKKIVNLCMEKGLLINNIGEKILRFLPPLVITKNDIDEFLNIMDSVFAELK